MKTGINPKVDCVFKAIFGANENKDLLIHLLNAILEPPTEAKICKVLIENPYNDSEFEKGRQSIVDIKARDQNHKTYQIEIQLLNTSGLKERMLWTWADIYHRQLKSGESFKSLNPTISVWLLDRALFPTPTSTSPSSKDNSAFHHQFGIYESQRGEKLSDHFDLHIIEMKKWNSRLKQPSHLDSWIKFLNCGQDLEPQNLPQDLNTPEIKKAMKTLERFSLSDKEHDLYMRRMEFLSVQATMEEDRQQALKDLEHAKMERERIKAEADAAKSEADAAKSEADAAKSEADAAKSEADTAKSEADAAKYEADAAKSEADTAKSEADAAKSEANAAKCEAEKTKKQLREVEDKVETLRAQAEEEIQRLKKQLAEVKKET